MGGERLPCHYDQTKHYVASIHIASLFSSLLPALAIAIILFFPFCSLHPFQRKMPGCLFFFCSFVLICFPLTKKGNSIGIGINLNFCFRPFPLYAAALRNLKHGCFTPPALINVIASFLPFGQTKRAFVIHAGAISFIASIRAEVKQIPYKSSPKVVPPVDLPKK